MSPSLDNLDEGRTSRLLFLTARKADYEHVLNQRETEKRLHQNHSYYYLATPEAEIRLTHVGMGAEQTSRTLWKLGGMLDPDFLLIAGSAGALIDDLKQDTLFMPTAITSDQQESWFHPPTDLLQWSMGIMQEQFGEEASFRSGPLYSNDQPVIDPDDRQELHDSTGALAVDMESTTILDEMITSDNPTPWSSFRVISDTFDDDSLDKIKKRQKKASTTVGQALNALIDSLF